MQVAPVVVRGVVVLSEEPALRGGIRLVWIGRGNPEFTEHIMGCQHARRSGAHRAEDEEPAVLGIPRMEGQAQDPLLAAGEQIGGQRQEHAPRRYGEVGDHHDPAGFLHDEESVGFARRMGDGQGLLEGQSRERIDERVVAAGALRRQTGESDPIARGLGCFEAHPPACHPEQAGPQENKPPRGIHNARFSLGTPCRKPPAIFRNPPAAPFGAA